MHEGARVHYSSSRMLRPDNARFTRYNGGLCVGYAIVYSKFGFAVVKIGMRTRSRDRDGVSSFQFQKKPNIYPGFHPHPQHPPVALFNGGYQLGSKSWRETIAMGKFHILANWIKPVSIRSKYHGHRTP